MFGYGEVFICGVQYYAEEFVLCDGGVLDSAHIGLRGAVHGGDGGEGHCKCLSHFAVDTKLCFNEYGYG